MAVAAVKQATFLWEGKDKKGNRVKGRGLARDEKEMRADLRGRASPQQGPQRVDSIQEQGQGHGRRHRAFRPAARHHAQRRHPHGAVLRDHRRGPRQAGRAEAGSAIKNDIETGNALNQALAKHPLYFDDLFVNLVEAGEHAGALETVLEKIATYKEKTEALKKKIKKALFYPAAVLAVAVIVTVILLLFVIPQFESLFQGFGADLPCVYAVRRGHVSRWMQKSGWLYGLILAAVVFTFHYFYKRSRPMRQFIDRMSLQVPVIGPILRKSAIARYARTLATMFGAGVPLVEAMKSVAGATGNIVYQDAVMRMRDEISTGMRMQRAMENTGLFPNMVVQMIAVGEESGSLDEMAARSQTFTRPTSTRRSTP
jgi:type IV pilus assembly protein PilC